MVENDIMSNMQASIPDRSGSYIVQCISPPRLEETMILAMVNASNVTEK